MFEAGQQGSRGYQRHKQQMHDNCDMFLSGEVLEDLISFSHRPCNYLDFCMTSSQDLETLSASFKKEKHNSDSICRFVITERSYTAASELTPNIAF